jgi:hypothetical protein
VGVGTGEADAEGRTAVLGEAVPLADASLRLMIRWIPVGMVLMALVLIAAIGRLALVFVAPGSLFRSVCYSVLDMWRWCADNCGGRSGLVGHRPLTSN